MCQHTAFWHKRCKTVSTTKLHTNLLVHTIRSYTQLLCCMLYPLHQKYQHKSTDSKAAHKMTVKMAPNVMMKNKVWVRVRQIKKMGLDRLKPGLDKVSSSLIIKGPSWPLQQLLFLPWRTYLRCHPGSSLCKYWVEFFNPFQGQVKGKIMHCDNNLIVWHRDRCNSYFIERDVFYND